MIHEIKKFEIYNLFGLHDHKLDFVRDQYNESEARISIIVGSNGIGKTTILNMIEGMLTLDFNAFRDIPFNNASLELSTGDIIYVRLDEETSQLIVTFKDLECSLHSKMGGEIAKDALSGVKALRDAADSILSKVSFEKLDIHRSIALRERNESNFVEERIVRGKLVQKEKSNSLLSGKVKRFVREAQVDYKKYFTSEGPSLFPRILKRLQGSSENTVTIDELIERLNVIKKSETEMSRFGLTLNISEIDQLTELLENGETTNHTDAVIAALEAYVETLESKHEERLLISARLTKFETLIGSFFDGKKVLVDYEKGLSITTKTGEEINELLLSSGEYHLLFMLVTALVSTRTGTAIAIDEPELSLHVSWQRKLIRALIECSSGASPLFIFATHSPAIAAEFQDQWISLGK